jgi:hypothetical protein
VLTDALLHAQAMDLERADEIVARVARIEHRLRLVQLGETRPAAKLPLGFGGLSPLPQDAIADWRARHPALRRTLKLGVRAIANAAVFVKHGRFAYKAIPPMP